ncbi:DUF3616 domain-containing protein [Aeoliella sp. SH292]|uniref:DUF3616 domain-containing protein n=1 Tax=Aeoliella sp. SH292 TaxID=3454464 RepID=UPI003F965A7A
MPRLLLLALFVLSIAATQFATAATPPSPIVEHQGICDASGVVDLGGGRFAVADDELNLLVIYQAGGDGKPLYQAEVSRFLDVVKPPKAPKANSKKKPNKKPKPDDGKPKAPKVMEVDIEGAARLGDTIYWIASHGRKSSGKQATERMRFFATTIEDAGDNLELVPHGTPYDELLDDLFADPQYAAFDLETAAGKAPKAEGGLSIEGITDTPSGELLIGFRNPLVDGKTLIATLKNPEEVLEGETARFAPPKLLDLDGNGIRGMSSHDGYYLIAANDPEGDEHHPRIYRWLGDNTRPEPIAALDLGDLNPEAIAVLPDYQGGRLLVLSDDGTRPIGPDDCPCKDLKDHSQRRFRSTTYDYADLLSAPAAR